MSLIVQKFGGSSVANAERIFNVADIITVPISKAMTLWVVVSAQGDTTDDLIAKSAGDQQKSLKAGNGYAVDGR